MAWYNLPITNGYSTTAVPGNWDSPHYAIDIGMPVDTPITSLYDGTVSKADYAPWGGEVFVTLANGLQEYFYHLDNVLVQAGQKIKVGTEVGLSGGQNTGGQHPIPSTYSSGPHLHFGITNGSLVPGPAGQQYWGVDPTNVITAARAGRYDVPIGTGGTSSGSTAATLSDTGGNGILPAITGVDLSGVNSFLTTIETPDTWTKIGLIALGGVLAVLGLYLLIKDDLPQPQPQEGGGGEGVPIEAMAAV